jgi:hypothetical protein
MAGPRFSTLDTTSDQEVRRLSLADSTAASVRENWLDISPRFLSLWATWDPGMMVQVIDSSVVHGVLDSSKTSSTTAAG